MLNGFIVGICGIILIVLAFPVFLLFLFAANPPFAVVVSVAMLASGSYLKYVSRHTVKTVSK